MRIVLAILVSLMAFGCAQVSPLTGGEKDNFAPQIIAEKSFPKHGELNYTEPKMTLVFNEFIVLKNPLNTISITPQPSIAPTITAKNKKLTILFNENLLPSTTYSVSFNGAITDLNEGNDSLFQYVFSTGSFIDSLKFSGMVNHSYSNKPLENILVGLYPITDSTEVDSLPFKMKPTYITQTNKNGAFTINYIKNGLYQGYAFSDIDRNLLFNPKTEEIGFINNFQCCTNSLSDSNYFKLFASNKIESGIKSATLTYPGQLTLVFNHKNPQNVEMNSAYPLAVESTEREDSTIYWLKTPYKKQGSFIVSYDDQIDTLQPIMKNMPTKSEYKPLLVKDNLVENKVLPSDTLTLTFNEPFEIVNKLAIRAFGKDSNEVSCETILKDARSLRLIPDDSTTYITIDSAAIKSTLTNATNNLITYQYQKHPETYYGTLGVRLKADSSAIYILELTTRNGDVVRSRTITDLTNSIHFKNLKPGGYQMRLVQDTDESGNWSTGDLIQKKQPETVYYYKTPVKIRSNWDLEIEWIISESNIK